MGICKLCRTVQTENMIDLQGAGRLYGRKQMQAKKDSQAAEKEQSAHLVLRTLPSISGGQKNPRPVWNSAGDSFVRKLKEAVRIFVNDGVILSCSAGVDLLGKSDKKCSILLWV